MAHCPKCNRKIKGKRSDHICDLALLSDGRKVHMDRVRNMDDEVRQAIERGDLKVEFQYLRNPVRTLSEKLGLRGRERSNG